MQLKTAKTASEAALSGVRVEFEILDKQIAAVLLTDCLGKTIRICKGGTYSDTVSVQVPMPPETEDKFLVTATLNKASPTEAPFSKTVDSAREADDLVRDLGYANASDVKVDPVQVAAAVDDVSEIPF